MENFATAAQGFAEGGEAARHDHEFLEVDRGVGVGAAVDDVHHGDGKHFGVGSADVFEKRLTELRGGGVGGGHGGTEDGVGAEFLFVRRAVELAHGAVDSDLVERVESGDGAGDGFVDVGHGFLHAFAEVTGGFAVAQFPSFMFAGAGAARDHGAPGGAALQGDFDFDGGVAARVDHFAAAD